MTRERHAYRVDTVRNRHQARCVCEWAGAKHASWGSAAREGQVHYQDEVISPRLGMGAPVSHACVTTLDAGR